MANDVNKSTLEKLEGILGGQLTQDEIKTIIYSAYSYTTVVNDETINDVIALLFFIDWKYYIEKKTVV